MHMGFTWELRVLLIMLVFWTWMDHVSMGRLVFFDQILVFVFLVREVSFSFWRMEKLYYRSHTVYLCVFSELYSKIYVKQCIFFFFFSILLLISAAFELLWCLLGDRLTKSKSLLPWHFTRQWTRFWVFWQ